MKSLDNFLKYKIIKTLFFYNGFFKFDWKLLDLLYFSDNEEPNEFLIYKQSFIFRNF